MRSDAVGRGAPGCSDALAKWLGAHRTVAVQAVLVANPAVGLVLVAHAFVLRALGPDDPRVSSALQVVPQARGSSPVTPGGDSREGAGSFTGAALACGSGERVLLSQRQQRLPG